jgi:hypothetical protein
LIYRRDHGALLLSLELRNSLYSVFNLASDTELQSA